jgi:hypothetical protein
MKIIKIVSLVICISLVGIYSCKKSSNLIDANNKWVYLDSTNTSNIKIMQLFAGNTPQIPTAPNATTGPQVFIYANGQKLNGLSLGYGSVWPTTNAYGNIPSGSVKFDIINARMDLTVVPNVPKFTAGDTLGSFTATLDKGKFYSVYIGDTVPNVRVTIKEDNLILPEPLTYKIRVANFSMNNNPTDTFNLFSVRQNAEIITDVTHKNVSDWVQIPIPILNDTLIFRKKGNILPYLVVSVPPNAAQRMVTLIAKGKTGVTGKLPSTTILINR